MEDKDEAVKGKNGLFADKNYTDREYFKDYPTIYHLRQALIRNEQPPYDVRFVYLAILNMFKHRGHFLNSSLDVNDDVSSMSEAYANFVEQADSVLGITFPDNKSKELEKILCDRNFSRSEKAEKIAVLLEIDKKAKKEFTIIKGICGLSIDARVLIRIIHKLNAVTFESLVNSEGY